MYLTLWTSSCQKILFLIASKKIFISHNKQIFQLHLPSIQMAIFLFNVFGREIYSVVMTIKLRLLWHVQIYPIFYMLTLIILSTLHIISLLLCSTPWHHPVFLKLVIVAPLSSMLQLLFKKNKRFWFLYTTNAALVYANDIKYVQDIKRGAGKLVILFFLQERILLSRLLTVSSSHDRSKSRSRSQYNEGSSQSWTHI